MAGKSKFMTRFAKKKSKGGSRPSAFYETYPRFVARDGVPYNIFILELDEFEFPPGFNPQTNISDEGCLRVRTHYFPKGLKGISGRNERYVYCPKTTDWENRCAVCEGYWAVWEIEIKPLTRDSAEWNAAKEAVKFLRSSDQNWRPILNVSALMKKDKPDCFQVEGKLDASTDKCKKCILQDYCYRKKIGPEMWNMPISTEKEFEKILMKVFGIEDESGSEVEGAVLSFEDDDEDKIETFDGDYSDPSNGLLWKIKYSKDNNKKTSIALKETGFSMPKIGLRALKEHGLNAQEIVDAIFAETHTYQQMLQAIPEDIQETMVAWFEEKGLDWPEDVIPDVDSHTSAPKEYKNCFGNKEVFDVDNDECVACPLFDHCSQVCDNEMTLEMALEELGFKEELEKEKVRKKKSENKLVARLNKKKKAATIKKEPEESIEEEDDDEYWSDSEEELKKEQEAEKTTALERLKKRSSKMKKPAKKTRPKDEEE